MKRSKWIISLALSLILLLGAAPPVAGGSGSIVIRQPGYLSLEGQIFHAYKIFDVTFSGEHYSYTIADGFSGFAAYPTYETQSLLEYIEGLSSDSPELDRLAANLWDYIHNLGLAPAGSATATNVDEVTISGLALGYYLVYGTALTEHGEILVAACSLTTTNEVANILLKVDAPFIEKMVYDDASGNYQKEADVNIGDTVYFRLTSAVPAMTGYTAYTYTVHDTMSAGLSFNQNSVLVTVGGAAFTDYDLILSPADGHTFDIIFDPAVFVGLAAGDAIEITYSAILNGAAVIGSPGNFNRVYLEYGTNPYTGGTGVTPDDSVEVYTFGIEIYKYTGGEIPGTPLADAAFELRRGSEYGEPVGFSLLAPIGEYDNAIYTHMPTGGDTELISPPSGRISLLGLAADIYYLVETLPPAGFNRVLPIEVVITREAGGAYAIAADGDITNTVNVRNVSGIQFPETGGIGRVIFYTVGLSLMGGAAVALISRRKRRRRHKF